MTSPPIVQYASRTDVGMRRAANQDSLAVRMCSEFHEWSQCGHLFVVADGMGGHAVGDLASRITVETLPHAYFKQDAVSVETRLRQSIFATNKAINDRARENREFEGMGTTCSVLSLSDRGAVVGHVGDSRVYRVRKGLMQQLTFDHSLQWEMIRLGRATAENVELFHPRNVITRCLGPDLSVPVDVEGPFSVEAGDVFLLCSDGLTNHVTDEVAGGILASLPPADSSRLLINLANCRGGTDNSTAIVIHVESYPQCSPVPRDATAFADVQPSATRLSGRGFFAVLFAALAITCLTLGVIAAAFGNLLVATSCGIASGISLLLSLRFRPKAVPLPVPALSLANMDMVSDVQKDGSALRSSFRTTSPYRTVDCRDMGALLSILDEVQSELVQAARDGDWKVDFDELTQLNRQALMSQQAQKPERAIRAWGRVIDLLMKEIYQRTRHNPAS